MATYTNFGKTTFVKVSVDSDDNLVNYNTGEVLRKANSEECAIWEDDELTGWQGDFFTVEMISSDSTIFNTSI